MNQLLVTSNGGVGRALFKLAGARALNVPAAIASASACVGAAGAAGAGCDGAGEQAATVKLSAAAVATARINRGFMMRMRAPPYFDSGVPRRAGRSSSSRPSGSVIDTKIPEGSPLRTGFTTTVTLSPGLMMFDFHPARIR